MLARAAVGADASVIEMAPNFSSLVIFKTICCSLPVLVHTARGLFIISFSGLLSGPLSGVK